MPLGKCFAIGMAIDLLNSLSVPLQKQIGVNQAIDLVHQVPSDLKPANRAFCLIEMRR